MRDWVYGHGRILDSYAIDDNLISKVNWVLVDLPFRASVV